MEKNKLILITLAIQAILALLISHRHMNMAWMTISTVMFLLNMMWSIFAAIFAISFKKKNILSYVSKFTFFSISALNILALLYMNLQTLINGYSSESALDFIVFPFYGFYIFTGSIILGSIIFFIKRRNQ